MKHYTVSISNAVLDDIDSISDFIISISTPEHAIKYKNQLISEINTLCYLADTIGFTQWKAAKKFHPKAKRLITKNRKWNVIFHTDGEFVIVDKLIPSKMIKG
ncbi:MAG: hypothetical protein IJP44_09035 [Bacteroidales bacterium]|nr:hypothetical protein [Bacteroidales bacterium]